MEKAQICDRLRQAIELRGLRAVDLVELTGIPKNTLSYYLSGKTEPKADRLYALARALNVSEEWLLGYDVSMARTDDQKKNDRLAQLVVKMKNDPVYFKAVSALADLDAVQFQTVVQLLGVLNK